MARERSALTGTPRKALPHPAAGVPSQDKLPAKIEDPNFSFDPSEAKSAMALDLLMGTRGYRRFEWQKVLGPQLVARNEAPADTGASGSFEGLRKRSTGAPPLPPPPRLGTVLKPLDVAKAESAKPGGVLKPLELAKAEPARPGPAKPDLTRETRDKAPAVALAPPPANRKAPEAKAHLTEAAPEEERAEKQRPAPAARGTVAPRCDSPARAPSS